MHVRHTPRLFPFSPKMEKVSGRHFDSDDDVIASDDQFQEVQDADFYKKKASVCSKPAGQSLKMEEEV